MLQPITPVGSASLSASSTTGNVALVQPGGQSYTVWVYSLPGDDVAYIAFGTSSSVEATTSDIPIPPGVIVPFIVPALWTHVAAICASTETASLTFTSGHGA